MDGSITNRVVINIFCTFIFSRHNVSRDSTAILSDKSAKYLKRCYKLFFAHKPEGF
jgi:hypothetical protein